EKRPSLVGPSVRTAHPPSPSVHLPFQAGDRFFQEVVFSRDCLCRTLGLDFRDQSRFALLSSLRVDEVTAKGGLRVTQKVEAVQLDRSAPALQARLNTLLRKTQGATFRLRLGPDGEVIQLKGAPKSVAAGPAPAPAQGVAFLVQSSLDPDAW